MACLSCHDRHPGSATKVEHTRQGIDDTATVPTNHGIGQLLKVRRRLTARMTMCPDAHYAFAQTCRPHDLFVYPLAVFGSWSDVDDHHAAPLDARTDDLVQDVVSVLRPVWLGFIDRTIAHCKAVVAG